METQPFGLVREGERAGWSRACLQSIGRGFAQAVVMDREMLLDDAQWALIEPLLPPQHSGKGRPMRDHRQVIEGVIYRYRCGIAWRDLPGSFGPWQTVWKRHRRFHTVCH